MVDLADFYFGIGFGRTSLIGDFRFSLFGWGTA